MNNFRKILLIKLFYLVLSVFLIHLMCNSSLFIQKILKKCTFCSIKPTRKQMKTIQTSLVYLVESLVGIQLVLLAADTAAEVVDMDSDRLEMK